jgi:AraC-like DNA-binding protein
VLTEISDDIRNRPFGQYQVAATSDHDEACAALESVFQPRRLRLEKTARPARALDLVLNTFPVGEVTVNYISFGCDVRISFEPENFHVNVPLRGVAESRTGEEERVRATPERGVVFMPGLPGEVDWRGGCAQLCLVFPRHAVRLQLEAMLGRPVRKAIEFAPVMDLRTENGQALLAALRLVERQARCPRGLLDHALAIDNLKRILIDGLLLAQPHNYTDALTRPRPMDTPSAVRQAIELMQSHPEQPWTTSSLASRTAVSVRSLQEGFQRSIGMAPTQYLRDVRLTRVHDDLRAAAPDLVSVGQVARRWGFLYLGRFAAAYREKFGQSPSVTLRAPRPAPLGFPRPLRAPR